MTQTIIAHRDAGTRQKVTEVIVRALAKAAKQPFVNHCKMPPGRLGWRFVWIWSVAKYGHGVVAEMQQRKDEMFNQA
jgi:hypothetical protein